MKTFLLLLLIATTSCSNDNTKDPIFQLPPETQTGANTFGVTINGKVYVPRDPTGVNVGGTKPRGMRLWGSGGLPNEYIELVVVDGASVAGFKITIHIQNFLTIGSYKLNKSNFQSQAHSVSLTHIYFKIWDNTIKNYAYYGSVDDKGEINIKRHDNGIISGNFSGRFVRYDNPNDHITISDGRFDINSITLYDTVFP